MPVSGGSDLKIGGVGASSVSQGPQGLALAPPVPLSELLGIDPTLDCAQALDSRENLVAFHCCCSEGPGLQVHVKWQLLVASVFQDVHDEARHS